MKTAAVIVGTVPEAVKLGPVCMALRAHRPAVRTSVVVTGWHCTAVVPPRNERGVECRQQRFFFAQRQNATLWFWPRSGARASRAWPQTFSSALHAETARIESAQSADGRSGRREGGTSHGDDAVLWHGTGAAGADVGLADRLR